MTGLSDLGITLPSHGAPGWDTGLNDALTKVADSLVVKNVRAFGATGNGSTDDYAAIQAALDSIPEASTYGRGGVVLIPPGKYKLSASLVPPPGVTLQGMGAPRAYSDQYGTVLFPSANDITLVSIDNSGGLAQGGFHVRDIAFENPDSRTGCIGLKALNRNRVNLTRCGFAWLPIGLDLEMAAGGDSAWHNIDSCWFYRCPLGFKHYGYGFSLRGGDFVSNNAAHTHVQLYADSSVAAQGAKIIGTKFDQGIGIDCQGAFNQFIGCSFEACAKGITVSHPAGAQASAGTRNQIVAPAFSSCTLDIEIADSACGDNAIIGYAKTGSTTMITDNGLRTTIISAMAENHINAVFPGAVATKTKSGAPADADWTVAPPNGTMVVDIAANPKRLYVRVGSNDWDYVTLT